MDQPTNRPPAPATVWFTNPQLHARGPATCFGSHTSESAQQPTPLYPTPALSSTIWLSGNLDQELGLCWPRGNNTMVAGVAHAQMLLTPGHPSYTHQAFCSDANHCTAATPTPQQSYTTHTRAQRHMQIHAINHQRINATQCCFASQQGCINNACKAMSELTTNADKKQQQQHQQKEFRKAYL